MSNQQPMDLTITDAQVAAFLQELAAYLEGHLVMLDAGLARYESPHKMGLHGGHGSSFYKRPANLSGNLGG